MSESLQEVCAEFMEKLKRLEYWDKLNRSNIRRNSYYGYFKPDACISELFVSSNRESKSWNYLNINQMNTKLPLFTIKKISR